MGYCEGERRGLLRIRVLRRLERGPARTEELARISLRYSARIFELRQAGYEIRVRRVGAAAWRYELVS